MEGYVGAAAFVGSVVDFGFLWSSVVCMASCNACCERDSRCVEVCISSHVSSLGVHALIFSMSACSD